MKSILRVHGVFEHDIRNWFILFLTWKGNGFKNEINLSLDYHWLSIVKMFFEHKNIKWKF